MTISSNAIWLLILLIWFLSTFVPKQEPKIIQPPFDQFDRPSQVEKTEKD